METYTSSDIKQELITDNEEIFNRIKSELNNAKSEILVVTSWFTDKDLLDVLVEKAKNIKVDLIIGDKEENNKLDFEQIKRAGGEYVKIQNSGYGLMHQKYCVIDKSLAIHGSYNF